MRSTIDPWAYALAVRAKGILWARVWRLVCEVRDDADARLRAMLSETSR